MEFRRKVLLAQANLSKRKFRQPLNDQTLARVKVKGNSQHLHLQQPP